MKPLSIEEAKTLRDHYWGTRIGHTDEETGLQIVNVLVVPYSAEGYAGLVFSEDSTVLQAEIPRSDSGYALVEVLSNGDKREIKPL